MLGLARSSAALMLVCLAIGLVATACGDDDSLDYYASCRFDPAGCSGGLGAFCNADRDCIHGFCCTERANCGGGMCTLPCRGDRDCPADMACEHDVCFFRCSSDRDCAPGQRCEHDHTVCEWP